MAGSGSVVRFHRGPQSKWQRSVKNLFRLLWREEEGQDLVEYALLVVLVALGVVVAMGRLADAIRYVFVHWVVQTLTT